MGFERLAHPDDAGRIEARRGSTSTLRTTPVLSTTNVARRAMPAFSS
jgi:hypothetical protein